MLSSNSSGFSLVSERFYHNDKCSSLFLPIQIQNLFVLLGNSGIISLVQSLEEVLLNMLSEPTEELWDQMTYVGLIEYMIHCICKGSATAMSETHRDLWSLFRELQAEMKGRESNWIELNQLLFAESEISFCIDEFCPRILEAVQSQNCTISSTMLQQIAQNFPWNCVQQSTGVWTGHVLEGFHGIALVLKVLGVSFEDYCCELINTILENKKDVQMSEWFNL